MHGYKAFDENLRCRGFQYEIGKEYSTKKKPLICQQGFHFCKTIGDCYTYYNCHRNIRICEVEAKGYIAPSDDKSKFCTNRIKIIREITDPTLLRANTSSDSTGFMNTGNCNAGDHNSGNGNVGNWNSGSANSGNDNSGHFNRGHQNSGNGNFGIRNAGHDNTGSRNAGSNNVGYENAGNHNTGSKCSGDWNAASNCSGCFCTETRYMWFFDKESDWTYQDWRTSHACRVMNQAPKASKEADVRWIQQHDMTLDELAEIPEAKTTTGHLHVSYGSDKARQEWWNHLPDNDKKAVLSLPNFDADKFYTCTHIHI